MWLGADSLQLKEFSEPHRGRHEEGYDCSSISDEQVTEIYLEWVRATRQRESEESLRTKTGTSTKLSRLVNSISQRHALTPRYRSLPRCNVSYRKQGHRRQQQ